MTPRPPKLIRTRAFRICDGLAACDARFAMAELQDDGSYTLAHYTDLPTGRDRTVQKQGLDIRTAVRHLYEWECEMKGAGYPSSAIKHFRSMHYADACREAGIAHPELKRRSEQHARKVKRTYLKRSPNQRP